MPGRDKTGPKGMGHMSGRGAGGCLGSSISESRNQSFNCGFRRGYGGQQRRRLGRSIGNNEYDSQSFYDRLHESPPYAPATQQQELSILQDHAIFLKKTLDEVNNKINKIESEEAD